VDKISYGADRASGQLFFCAIEPEVGDSRAQEALGFAAKIAGFNGT
jgi:hypothetical protein